MMALVTVVKLLILGLTLGAVVFYLMCIIAAIRFFKGAGRETGPSAEPPSVPVSLMVPLHGADFEAYENYASLCRQDYPEYQIVFGVRDESDTAVPIIRKLIADFPDRDLALVIDAETIGQNLKVSNLRNMLRAVKHEVIVIVDSDIRVGLDYLRNVVAPLADERVGLVTCLYRSAEAPDFGAKLEAIGITAEFMPGVLIARMIEGVKFALGSTIATTRARLGSIGGFEALADYLADDFMMGNLVARSGYEVRLSSYVVETAMAPVGVRGMMRHQVRWGRSTRKSRPLGYLGLVVTHGTALGLLYVAVDRASPVSLLVLVSTLAVRLIMGWLIGVHWLRDGILKRYFWMLPLRDVLSFVIWCLSMVGKRVEWRGRLFDIVGDGKIVEVAQD